MDQCKQGYGTTSASITRINEEIIIQFHVILPTISGGCELKFEEFRKYAKAPGNKQWKMCWYDFDRFNVSPSSI